MYYSGVEQLGVLVGLIALSLKKKAPKKTGDPKVGGSNPPPAMFYFNSPKRTIPMEEIIAGIDEAGRGAVIGPLVIAGVSLEKSHEQKLKEMGAKDSKLLSPRQREILAKKIEKIAQDIVIVKLSACRIDSMRKGGINLNRIEAMKFAEILNLLAANTAYIDSPDVTPSRLADYLKKMLKKDMQLVVEHKADVNYPIASAASIIAKVARDQEVKELHKEYGDFGPGYSSNEKTVKWLRDYYEKNRDFPDIVRKGWETIREMRNEKSQKGIAGFLKKIVEKEKECDDPKD